MSLYEYDVKAMDGSMQSLSTYKGKVLLIVNTATGCAFTPQYEGLESLYEKYSDQGFVILDFPCNQFGSQAPGTEEEIHTFCTGRYGITFPQFAKIDVNGEKEDPLYTYLKNEKGGFISNKVKWNFTKFLVDREGTIVDRFGPTQPPHTIDAKIAALL
ncbi:MAG: glutathione peroxidase [Lachnospiraceae bacterium]|jgi:glutathione peroxidase|nr:glutathione peroxidase [Lachnospiraceae bacterium]